MMWLEDFISLLLQHQMQGPFDIISFTGTLLMRKFGISMDLVISFISQQNCCNPKYIAGYICSSVTRGKIVQIVEDQYLLIIGILRNKILFQKIGWGKLKNRFLRCSRWERVQAGNDFYRIKGCEISYKITPRSFYQLD